MRYFLFLFWLAPMLAAGQTICTSESRDRLDTLLSVMSKIDFTGKTIQETTVEIGKWFLGTPYVEKTLEIALEQESLVINLTGLDCTTYLETVVTLARLAKMGEFTYEAYEKELEFLRYRNGILQEYPSRLHYFSDWIYDNEQKGIITDVTKEIGGVPYENKPSFMTENPGYYAQLSNVAFVEQLKLNEQEISTRQYFYLPKETAKDHESKILPGDLIATTISRANLDISHVGFAVEKNGRIHLMHASSDLKMVVISENPLSDYLMGNKSQTGIMVCRLKEPQ